MLQVEKQITLAHSTSGSYYAPETMPLVRCGACLLVALQASESARQRYYEIVETFRLPDAKTFFGHLESVVKRKEGLSALLYRQTTSKINKDKSLKKARALFESLGDIIAKETERVLPNLEPHYNLKTDQLNNEDIKLLIGRISEFIKDEFNYRGRKPKLTSETAGDLALVIIFRAIAEYRHFEIIDEGHKRGMKISGEYYDFTVGLDTEPDSRKHKALTKYYQDSGMKFKHDDKILQEAERWYQCRVVYGSITRYCGAMLKQGITLRVTNVSNEIKKCDEALGYPRRR